MNKCIYLKTSDNQKFEKEEHIIPAGIGGIKKLPKGYVSDYINGEVFSAMELNFMRESIISIPRMFIGPGKRGSLSKKNESKSKVFIATSNNDKNELHLCYIKKGRPHSINQIYINNKRGEAALRLEVESNKEKFLNILEKINEHQRMIKIIDSDLQFDEVIIGERDKKLYIACNNKNINMKNLKKNIDDVILKIKKGNSKEEIIEDKITAKIKYEFKIKEFTRISAKTVFNYIAFKYGQEFVLDDRFNIIRNYIVSGTGNANVRIIKKINYGIDLPDDSHSIFVTKINNYLVGVVSFYGGNITVFVELCELNKYIHTQDNFFSGYICDWKNKREFDFLKFLNELNEQNEVNNIEKKIFNNIR